MPDLLIAIVLGLLATWVVALGLLWLLRPRGTGAGDVVRVVPDVLRLARVLIADPVVPLDVRLALVALAGWIVSPIDLVPEFLPVIGPLDDVVVAILVLRYVRRRVGAAEVRRRWPGTPAGWAMVARVIGAEDDPPEDGEREADPS
jgi:uncharacterized membrane protein YkvA (DUF1232 family)